jgi:hypothetical protein
MQLCIDIDSLSGTSLLSGCLFRGIYYFLAPLPKDFIAYFPPTLKAVLFFFFFFFFW